jgi:glycosyltransferase involved in cell wall biosynthesis
MKCQDLDIYFGCRFPERIRRSFSGIAASHILRYTHRSVAGRLLIELPRLLKKGFDWAHFQNVSPIGSRCKTVVTLHDVLFEDFPDFFPFPYRRLRRFWFQRSISNASLRTTVSGYSRERIEYHYRIPRKSIHVLPNAAQPTNHFQNTEAARAYTHRKFGLNQFILYVSRIEPRKNHVALLEAFLGLTASERYHLVFVGNQSVPTPGLQEKLLDLDESTRSRIIWLPQVDERGLEALYRSASVFVYPSFAEGFGIPPLEAAAYQAPVLCAFNTAMTDFQFFENNFFNSEDAGHLKAKLNEVLEATPDEDTLTRVNRQARRQYNWQRTATLFHNLLTQY